ncbi:hypothetical protein RhiLY_02802 [Ceratobasidium sp. AG-Ba]|nr:hypothetical protein RhiLY_02802 [Ceratobasidium sp. AG-Ba]
MFTQKCQKASEEQLKARKIQGAQENSQVIRVLELEQANSVDEPSAGRFTSPKSCSTAGTKRLPNGNSDNDGDRDPPAEGYKVSRPLSLPVFPLPHLSPLPANCADTLRYDEKRQVYVELFPNPFAGAPINDKVVEPLDLSAYMASIGNLGNPDLFDTAELLMTTGLTNMGRDAHLKSRLYKEQTPWVNNKLIADIDQLPHGPDWSMLEIRLDEAIGPFRQKQPSYLFMRSVIATFRDLMANPAFRDNMQYAPRRDWTAEDMKCRVYGETCSGNWWWTMQEQLQDKFGTIVPLIISHDRTSLSVMTGGHQAYPVYLTLGNIDKSLRRKLTSRATALLAYLPTDKFSYVVDKEMRSRLKRELTHRAMEALFHELHTASAEGVETLCADGRYRRAYPTVAALTLDNEDQVLGAGVTPSGCPKCITTYKNRGSGKLAPARKHFDTLCAMHAALEDKPGARQAAKALELEPIWPWWANMPNLDFAGCLMPDILHQLHQGMLRHLLKWTYKATGKAEVDRYFVAMPIAEGMRHFRQGVSGVQQWSGRESKEVEKQLLPVIASLDFQGWDHGFVRLSRALLDFIYRAQASRMTEDEIVRLEKTLVEIHKFKPVLKDMAVFKTDSRFNKIAKLHMLSHWPGDTRQMGTADGFSTETPEHSHIESKRAWRASNKVCPTPQMIRFIQRYEALRIHRAQINTYLGRVSGPNERQQRGRVVYGEDEEVPFQPTWELNKHVATEGDGRSEEAWRGSANRYGVAIEGDDDGRVDEEDEDEDQEHYPGRMRTAAEARQHVVYPNPTLSIAAKPTTGRVRGIDIATKYGATDLISALHSFLNKHSTRKLPPLFLPTLYDEYPLWHRLYLRHQTLPFDPDWTRRDVIRARPEASDTERAFDVALILHDCNNFGIHRYRAGRVRAIFALPAAYRDLYPDPLVYVELFTPFSTSLSADHRMHSLSQQRFEGKRRVAVFSAFDLAAACHIAPQFKRLDENVDLDSLPDLLEVSRFFWLNHYYNRFIYRLIDHWRFMHQV